MHISLVSQICIRSLHRDNNDIIFKNLHFATRFQKFVFSGPQNAVVLANAPETKYSLTSDRMEDKANPNCYY